MTQPAKAQEPSMEEILASIRRIIADDDASKPDAAKSPPKAAEPAKPAPVRPAPAPPPPPRPAAAAVPPPKPAPPPAPAPAVSAQDDIDALFNTPDPAPADEEEKAESNDVLDLTEAMETPSAPPLRRVDGNGDVAFNEAEPEPEPPPLPTVELARRQFQQHTGADRSLLSPTTTAAVDSAFNSLAQTVLVQNARTLDDLVREMLRPMLKAWLDDNLPTMVERLVRAEIERVSRGR